MTEKFMRQLDAQIAKAFKDSLYRIPKKSGNLRYKAVKYKPVNWYKRRVYIDLTIAPYGFQVNEKGKSEGYLDKFFQTFVNNIQINTGARRVYSTNRVNLTDISAPTINQGGTN